MLDSELLLRKVVLSCPAERALSKSAWFAGYSVEFDPLAGMGPLWFECPFEGLGRTKVPAASDPEDSNFDVFFSTSSPLEEGRKGLISAKFFHGRPHLSLIIYVSDTDFDFMLNNSNNYKRFMIHFEIETNTSSLGTDGNVIRFSRFRADNSERWVFDYYLNWHTV